MFTRRTTLFGLAGTALGLAGCGGEVNGQIEATRVSDRNLLQVPVLYAGQKNGAITEYDLTLQRGRTAFFDNQFTPTIGINQSYLGPTLDMVNGADVRMSVTNTLEEDATLHWHGFHVPARYDGTPHQRIAPGETWTAQFQVRQKPSLFWYHSHAHRRAGPQVYHGLAGPIIVRDDEGRTDSLPHEYGIDDVPLIVQDRAFGSDGRLIYARSMHDIMMGMRGDTLLVNGVIDPAFECQTELLRLRLLNGSNARIYDFEFETQQSFLMTGSDGGHLEAPVRMSRIRLSPGERAEIVVDASHGVPLQLLARSLSGEMGMMDGGMMGGRWGRGNSRRSSEGSVFKVLLIVPNEQLRPSTATPAKLTTLPAIDPSKAIKTRRFVLEMGMGMGMRGRGGFTINGKSMDMARIDERVKLDTTEIWEVENASMMAHPFHVHDVQFRILDRNGRPPPEHEMGLKDTVLLSSRERVRLLLSFKDYADSDTPYMYHCHILEHEDAGMMGQFVIEA